MKRYILWGVFVLLAAFTAMALDNARLLRFPDVNGNRVVFVYAGDIWTVPTSGGSAVRLTSQKGMELFPKISPDGKWIAFSGEYSGSRQVFVMPSIGGTPRQLTWYNDVGVMPPRGGFDDIVLDWTPDSRKILIRSNRTPYGKRMGKYFLVSLDGGLEEPLQIPEAGFGSFSPDGEKICYTPISREFRTWKRYKGGRAADVWIYNLSDNTSRRLTTFPGSDQIPRWYKDSIYFASDRDLKLNIYRYDLKTDKITQITHHREFDTLWPSGRGNQLVYENGGFLYLLNLDTGKTDKMTVNIRFDDPNILPYMKNVAGDIHSADISPSGKRAVLDARGDIFTVPAKSGVIRNLTRSQGVREIFPAWSPDGRWIAYFSDQTGEYEVYIRDKDGKMPAKQLTRDSSSWKFPAVWSPDSKWLLFSDKNQELQLLDVKEGKITVVDRADRHDIRDYTFSPDSSWVAYSKNGANGQEAVWVYSLSEKKPIQLTGDTFNDSNPTFSTDGKYLFFMSNRDFNLTFSAFEFNYVYTKATRIYAAALTSDVPKLFPFENDVETVKREVAKPSDKGRKAKAGSKKKMEKVSEVRIDPTGIDARTVAFPMKSGRYSYLQAVKGGILYGNESGLHKFDIGKKKDSIILAGVRGAILSADGKKLLYRKGKTFGIAAVQPGQKGEPGKLNLANLTMKIDPVKEWRQIYVDGWRIFRDWFYADNLHGVDWKAMRKKYAKLLPSISHRADLDYIFGELVGEMNVGHAYVNWGDFPRVKRVNTGLLGCEFTPDTQMGRYRITKIYQGENWNKSRRSPLTEQGVDVHVGDYLMKIDGYNVTLKDNPYSFLEGKAGRHVPLTVASGPKLAVKRTVLVKPISSELELRYLDWVNSRRKLVDKLSGGRIGYIHVPNTSFEGNRELFKGMYAYHNKEALIIDDRYNGGGFIPDVMTGLLERRTLSYWARRGVKPNSTPGIAHDGPKVMLINHYSSSGGDAFPYYFKKRHLGTLIGTRTWGGLVGLSGNAGLVDGGSISVPSFGVFGTDGKWVVEGIGIYPDIEVEDRPEQVAAGHDPCVEKAVQVLLKKLKEKPPVPVKQPKFPVRSGWHEGDIH
ncbi:MAG: acetyl-CoA synthetase [Acidobacteria bacterium]|nr:MAG: acetyl-CoA synthetase [Acidobacteriota bacterium]